jgi:anti-sigma regulatory factor (Ser/Thr protein kinase)
MNVTSRFHLEPVPEAVRVGRTAVQSDSALADLPEATKRDMTLVVSELVSNAVMASTAGTPVTVEISRTELTVTISVVNVGTMEVDESLFSLPDAEATQGRGLGIVHSLARSVDISSSDGSTTVTAVLDVHD